MSGDPGDLAGLADLVLPPPVPFWPPAAGICILGVAALAMLAVLGWRALRRYRADAYLRSAAHALDALAAGQGAAGEDTAEAVSSIVKRAAIVAYGRQRVAALTGAAWTKFIADTAPGGASTDAIAASLEGAVDARGRKAPARVVVAQARIWLRGQRGRAAMEA